jgi:hypothetical protein
VQRVNVELKGKRGVKKVHADLVAFAKAHNLEIIKKERLHGKP